ncbi:glycosyltransferase 87 family protein [Streptoalloteichus hindustanus]|uniref:Alpha-1,2-mannosyltransferase n=1 Tax=Streptoalloteichus hindustanus TaxID=2017 RepID=A0A1M5AWX1_STRHI|nr:glycosyltransferase 87 family protein [Streptoalloteichus hindustanus]SHF34710.1 alpha-1,2-mannosyltransferase [Streptoalloteichus hindustanus]
MLRRRPVPTALLTPRPRNALAAGVAVLAVALYAVQAYVWPLERWFMFDLDIYRQGGRALLEGTGLYTAHFNGLPFTNTPFSALLFAGLAVMPMAAARLVMAGLTIGALVLAVWCVTKLVGMPVRQRFAVVATASAVGLWLEPVQGSLTYGQVNVVLMALVLLDFVLPRRVMGIGIGLATAVKLTPGLFVVYLLLTRRFRAVGVASATVIGTVALGFLVAPQESGQYWSGEFMKASRIGGDVYYFGNQSLRALLGRLTSSTMDSPLLALSWFVIVALVAFLGLRAALRLHRRGSELGGILTCALTALLISPVSWHHHWVWCVPLVVHLWLAGRRRLTVGLVVLLATWPKPGKAFPLPEGLLGAGFPLSELYVVLGLIVLGVVVRATRAGKAPDGRLVPDVGAAVGTILDESDGEDRARRLVSPGQRRGST